MSHHRHAIQFIGTTIYSIRTWSDLMKKDWLILLRETLLKKSRIPFIISLYLPPACQNESQKIYHLFEKKNSKRNLHKTELLKDGKVERL